METKSNHSASAAINNAPVPTSQQNINTSQSATDKTATTMENNLSSTVAATVPVQSIDILKETKEKVDITKTIEDVVGKVPSMKISDIPILSSVINQKARLFTSEEQVEIPAPNPTIVAQSIDSVFLAAEATDKLPSVQTVFPQQTIQSSAAQFKAELTVKGSVDDKIDAAPQELSFRRNTSSAPNNTFSNNNNSTGFDGFAGKMNKLRDQMSNIFPAGIMGCREKVAAPSENVDQNNTSETSSNSRRFMDAKEASLDCVGHMDSTPRKRPSSCKPNTGRNPLTGIGLDDADDSKRGFGRRKDGNPVLGVGYGNDTNEESKKPSGRVPPGGHSTKLW